MGMASFAMTFCENVSEKLLFRAELYLAQKLYGAVELVLVHESFVGVTRDTSFRPTRREMSR